MMDGLDFSFCFASNARCFAFARPTSVSSGVIQLPLRGHLSDGVGLLSAFASVAGILIRNRGGLCTCRWREGSGNREIMGFLVADGTDLERGTRLTDDAGAEVSTAAC